MLAHNEDNALMPGVDGYSPHAALVTAKPLHTKFTAYVPSSPPTHHRHHPTSSLYRCVYPPPLSRELLC